MSRVFIILTLCFLIKASLSCNFKGSHEAFVSTEIRNEQIRLLKHRTFSDSNSVDAIYFSQSLRDSFNHWLFDLNLDVLQPYREDEFKISNCVVFDDSKSKGVGFLIVYRKSKEGLDSVIEINGELVDGEWRYNFLSNWVRYMQNCKDCQRGKNGRLPDEIILDRIFRSFVLTMNIFNGSSFEYSEEFFNNRNTKEGRRLHLEHFITNKVN